MILSHQLPSGTYVHGKECYLSQRSCDIKESFAFKKISNDKADSLRSVTLTLVTASITLSMLGKIFSRQHTEILLTTLTHYSLETHKRVIGKQYRPRSDTAEHSI